MRKFITLCFMVSSWAVWSNEQSYPTPPKPDSVVKKTVSKAGMGSGVPYSQAGVIELGGSASYTSTNNFNQLALNPEAGWFFTDNMKLNGSVSFNYISSGKENATYWTALVGPSYHYPFNKTTFGFLELGAGAAYSSKEVGFAIRPKVGANFLIGRSGILTPALHVTYNTIDSLSIGGGTKALAVDSVTGFSIGYTVIW